MLRRGIRRLWPMPRRRRRHRCAPTVQKIERAPVRGMVRVHRECSACGKPLGWKDEPEW